MKPSDVYRIQDPVAAFCFDRAVYLFGSHMQSDLDAAEASGKSAAQVNGRKQRVLAKWLGVEAQYKNPGVVSKADSKIVDSSVPGPVSL